MAGGAGAGGSRLVAGGRACLRARACAAVRTKDDILAVLDKVRKRDAAVMDETLDRMRNALEPFVQEMTAAAREAASWYR